MNEVVECTVNEIIECAKKKIVRLFEEDVELVLYDYVSSIYPVFRIKRVNGNLINHKVLVSFYNEQIFLPWKSREGYAGRLRVVDASVFGYGEYATKDVRFRTEDCENETYAKLPVVGKVSFVDMLSEAYVRSCKFTEERVQEMVAEVLNNC